MMQIGERLGQLVAPVAQKGQAGRFSRKEVG